MEILSAQNLIELIKIIGYLGIAGIVFGESGLLIGFFLPGDSLLFAAGFLASQGYLSIYILVPLIFLSGLLGDNVGYYIGKKLGKKIYAREKAKYLNKDNILKAEEFYRKHGAKTILVARFLPFVRTFAPPLAGASRMKYSRFFAYNIVGNLIWSCGVTLLGYFLGGINPEIDKYILPVIIGVMIASFIPSISMLVNSYIKKIIKKVKTPEI